LIYRTDTSRYTPPNLLTSTFTRRHAVTYPTSRAHLRGLTPRPSNGGSFRRLEAGNRHNPGPRPLVWGGLAAYGWRMAVPRGGGNPRGTRAPGAASKPPQARPELAEPEQVADPHAPRGIIDYTLQRRAALGSLVLVATGASDHLDPHPHLLRAARNHGVPAGEPCPWCKSKDDLATLNYAYGDELGPYSGRLRTQAELARMATEHGRFRVYLVEVCRSCGWNHLLRSYVLGDGVPRPALRATRDMLD